MHHSFAFLSDFVSETTYLKIDLIWIISFCPQQRMAKSNQMTFSKKHTHTRVNRRQAQLTADRNEVESFGFGHRFSGVKQKCLQSRVTLHVCAAHQMMLKPEQMMLLTRTFPTAFKLLSEKRTALIENVTWIGVFFLSFCSPCAHNGVKAVCVPAQTHQVSPLFAAPLGEDSWLNSRLRS